MLTEPMPVRFDAELQKLLREGVRRTPHKKQELIRLTLRRHLRSVIEQEAAACDQAGPLTHLKPWSKKELEAAYRRLGAEWDQVEEAATRAQGKPSFED
jgi:hypothetical protein